MNPSGGINVQASRRLHSKPPAPPPPQKLKKFDPLIAEIQDVPTTFSVSSRKGLIKPLQDQIKNPQGLAFRKLDDQTLANGEGAGGILTKTNDENKVSLTHNGETLLATFYGMLYTNDGAEKEWKLEVEGFIPVCFVQVHGNANKPFRIVAVEKTRRIMEYQVTVNTTCAKNLTFVKWQDGVAMFGARFAKEEQAEQFFNTVKRMASTLAKAAQLLKQPERKAALKQMSDPLSSSNIHHTKVSLMIKLPDKQTTIMSVPGLLTMSELFETICEKEHLNTAEHQLSLPRIGARKVTFDSGTAIGSLKIREVSIIRTAVSDSGVGSVEVEDESLEDLLDVEGEESKILQIFLPTGTRKSYRVSVEMTMKQLVMRVCSRERLNPRHHSLQYIDFKHEFLGMASTVGEIEVNQIRLMDNREFRKGIGEDLDSALSPAVNDGHKETSTSLQRSKSLDVLSNDREPEVFSEQDGQLVDKDSPRHSAANGSVPSAVRRHSSGGSTNKKPPVVPLPYVPKSSSLPQKPSRDVRNGSLKNSNLSPIKRDTIFSASTPDLSLCSAKSDDSPGSGNVKTSTPDVKTKQRRAAPRPPPRPAVPKALFADGKVGAQANRPGLLVKTSTPMPGTNPLTAPTAVDGTLKPRHKKRPAPPRPARPARPPPLHPARQNSTESKDSRSSEEDFGKKEDAKPQLKPSGIIRRPDRPALSLELDPTFIASQKDEAAEDDLRGVPIFIPPPPPDELPPPLDECETPVGPLTDFEADILEGSASEGFPVTANGFVGIVKYLAPSQTNENEQMQNKSAELQNPTFWSNKEAALATVPEHDSVVPPPPMYSQTPASSSSEIPLHTQPTVLSNKRDLTFKFPDLSNEASTPSVADIPPPLLETEATSTSQESEGKDRDSGFDQSPENLHITPPSDSSENVAVQSWEDVDSGSSLDGINAIPPPMDFATTRPITPPCQFANATVAPPEGFVEEKPTEHEPPKTQLRKKLHASESLFPWMNEPQAPVNATVPLVVSLDKEGAPEDEIPNKQQKLQNSVNMVNEQGCGAISQGSSASVVVPCAYNIANQRHEDQRYSGLSTTDVTAKHAKEEVKATVNVKENSSIELKPLSCDDEGAKKVEIPTSKGLETAEVVVAGVSSIETELSGSHKMSDKILNFPRPATKPKPVRSVQEEEIKVELSNSGDQRTQLFYPPMEVARQEAETVVVEEESRIKPIKPETKVKPVLSVKEKVKVQTSSVSREGPELLVKPVKLESQVKHKKQEGEPVKEAEVKFEGHKPSVSNVSRDNTRPAFGDEAVNIELPVVSEKTPYPSPWINETKVHVEAHASSSSIPTVDVTEKPAECEQTEVEIMPEKLDATVKEEEIKVELKLDVHQSFYSYGGDSEIEPPQFENVQLGVQSESEKREKLQSNTVQEVIIPQLKPEVESSIKVIENEDSEFDDGSLNEAKCEANTTVQKLTTTIVPVGTDDVVETLVTPETKPTSSSHDTLKDLEERLLELDKGSEPSPLNSRTSESITILAAYQEPIVQSKDRFVEDVIVAETKQVEFSSYDQFQELLKLDNEETKPDEVASKGNEEDPRGNAIREEQHPPYSDLHLDLSPLRKTPEPPLPPSSSPPVVAVSPRSSILPSPRELLSDRSTESGISLIENKKDFKPVQTPSAVSNSPAEEPPNVAAKLQRPLSMPEGRRSDSTNIILADKSKSAVELDSRKSSTSESTGISSSSLPSSPVESDQQCNADLVDLPKPPPFTVPPLRRYSDLAANLSFISSAAKAAEKSHEGASKPSAPPKPVHSSLKRSSFSVEERPRSWVGPDTGNKNTEKSNEDVSKSNTPPKPVNSAQERSSSSVKEPPKSWLGPETRNSTGKPQEDVSKPSAPPKPVTSALKRSSFSVEERPRSWMGPEANTKNTINDNKRSLMFPSAFKPVSFDMQGKKVVRPVDFNVKPLNTSSAVESASSAKHYTVSTNKNTQATSSVEKLEEPSKPVRAVAEKPLNTSSVVPSASAANHYTVPAHNKVQATSSVETLEEPSKPVRAVAEKPLNTSFVVPSASAANHYTVSAHNKVQARSSVETLEEPSKPDRAVAEKPLNTSSVVPSASAANHYTVSAHNKVQATSSVETLEEPSKRTHAVAVKPEWKSTSSVVPEVSQPVKLESTTSHQPTSADVKTDPQSKKSELHEAKYEIIYSGSASETPDVSQNKLNKTGSGLIPPSKSLSSSSSIRDQILRDATGGNRITRARPQSAIVSGSKYQCLSADEKVSSITGANWADVKKLASLKSGSAKSGGASWVKKETSDSNKPELPHVVPKPTPPVKTADVKAKPLRGGESEPRMAKGDDDKPQQVHGDVIKKQPAKTTDIIHQPVKTAADVAPHTAVSNGSLPNIVMRSKTGPQDLTKRHSMPTYTIEGADRKQPHKPSGTGGQFNFIMPTVQRDTTVVPQGVVAAMKALREKKGHNEGE